jgi:hypothetical protein
MYALLVIALLGVGAQEVTPNTSPATATESSRSVSKLNAQKKADKSQQAIPDKPKETPCIQCFTYPPIEQPQAKSKEEQAKTDSLDLLYRRYMWATIIGVGGGLIGVGILIWQAILTRTTARAAIQSIEIIISKERARIYIEPDGFDFDVSDEYDPKYEVKYKITCSGTTPAIIYDSRITAEIGVTQERSQPERWAVQIPLPSNLVQDGIELRIPLSGESDLFNEVLDEQIESGKLFVNFWGYINYRDLFFKGDGFWRKNFRYTWNAQIERFIRCGEPWENAEKKKVAKKPN